MPDQRCFERELTCTEQIVSQQFFWEGCWQRCRRFSQEGGRSDATVQVFGSFLKTTTDNDVQQGATNSGGLPASYRFFFSNGQGVEVNYGYSLNTQTYGLASGLLGVKSNQHEVTAAYVYRHALRRFTPFVEAGVGSLVFAPTDAPAASTQARAAFVCGGGAEYRGLVYNSPTFDLGPSVGHRSCNPPG
jgi:hypothetical protein